MKTETLPVVFAKVRKYFPTVAVTDLYLKTVKEDLQEKTLRQPRKVAISDAGSQLKNFFHGSMKIFTTPGQPVIICSYSLC